MIEEIQNINRLNDEAEPIGTEADIFNSCVFCACCRGVHKYTNPENNEIMYLCDIHKTECYNSETDTVFNPAPVIPEEPEAA